MSNKSTTDGNMSGEKRATETVQGAYKLPSMKKARKDVIENAKDENGNIVEAFWEFARGIMKHEGTNGFNNCCGQGQHCFYKAFRCGEVYETDKKLLLFRNLGSEDMDATERLNTMKERWHSCTKPQLYKCTTSDKKEFQHEWVLDDGNGMKRVCAKTWRLAYGYTKHEVEGYAREHKDKLLELDGVSAPSTKQKEFNIHTDHGFKRKDIINLCEENGLQYGNCF